MMALNFTLIIFMLFVGAVKTEGIIVGGWSTADVKSNQVKNACAFAVKKEFPTSRVSSKVSSAMKQIVAGTNYDITVAITMMKTNNCTMRRYVVYQKFDQTYQLTKKELMTKKCPK